MPGAAYNGCSGDLCGVKVYGVAVVSPEVELPRQEIHPAGLLWDGKQTRVTGGEW